MATTTFEGPVVSRNGFRGPITGAFSGITPLTDNSGGTPSNTIADVPASYTEATLANQIASIVAKLNAIINALD